MLSSYCPNFEVSRKRIALAAKCMPPDQIAAKIALRGQAEMKNCLSPQGFFYHHKRQRLYAILPS